MFRSSSRRWLAAGTLFGFASFATALQLAGASTALTVDQKQTLELVTADALRAHVKFLSDDALEGRNTPSPGLDKAARYIADEFKKAGLEPLKDGSYFQKTTYTNRRTQVEASVQNVLGVLRGSDEKLKETYILVSAHYDHLGKNEQVEGEDKIFNGANDNGSGTAGVIELAKTLSKLKQKPKRSIVFVLWYGEEKGLVGSRFYGQNPVFPLKDTVALINFEQIGRTDDSEAPRISALSMTGYDYSDIGPFFSGAGEAFGVKVEKHPQNSDRFFTRSDNAALAASGIPSHTVSTAFEFPDYHKVGDHWDKLDYANMAKVVKAAGAGILALADSEKEPRWNESNERTKRFVEAWKKLHG